jgi:hypothetical protein
MSSRKENQWPYSLRADEGSYPASYAWRALGRRPRSSAYDRQPLNSGPWYPALPAG